MKGVPIKFRGTSIKTQCIVYGDLMHYGDQVHIRYQCDKDDFYDFASTPVYPDSIVQLVCYDAEGNEVYEGDTIDAVAYNDPSFKYTFKAVLTHNVKVSELMAYCVKLVKRGNKNE